VLFYTRYMLLYVVLRKEEKPVPCGKIVDTTECMTLEVRFRFN
jgi:hypothetical protein